MFQRHRARRAHQAALAILHHALDTKYRDVPPSQLRLLDVLDHWHATMIARPDRTAEAFARVDAASPAGKTDPVRSPLTPAAEDVRQTELVEQALASGRVKA